MSKVKMDAVIISQERIAEGIYSMWFEAEPIAKEAKAGQFVAVYSDNGANLLPRPISICEIDKEGGRLRIVYRVVGKGTDEFSKKAAGDRLVVMGPLGNGFTLKDKKALLIGGGIGIPPMLELAKSLDCEKAVVAGYRSELFLNEDFEKVAPFYVATEDGSTGTKGTVIDAINANGLEADIIYACGPTPMLRALKEYAISNDMEAQISMEEKMACGIGACLACVCKSKEKDEHTNVNNKRICKDGPVFDAREVEL